MRFSCRIGLHDYGTWSSLYPVIRSRPYPYTSQLLLMMRAQRCKDCGHYRQRQFADREVIPAGSGPTFTGIATATWPFESGEVSRISESLATEFEDLILDRFWKEEGNESKLLHIAHKVYLAAKGQETPGSDLR